MKPAFDADEAATRLVNEVLAGRELHAATRPPAAGWSVHLEPVTSTYFFHHASTGEPAWDSPPDAVEAAELEAAARPFVRRKGRDPRAAQFWYYKDRSDQKQGPNYPGHMRDWFAAGHFPETHSRGSFLSGEVPRQADYFQIRGTFEEPLKQTAFCWPGIPRLILPLDDASRRRGGRRKARRGRLAGGSSRTARSLNDSAGPVLKGSFCDLHW